MLEICVPDVLARIQPLFLARMKPRERFAAGQALIIAPDGLRQFTDDAMRQRYAGGYAVMEAVLQDGYDVIEGRQFYGLFNPARTVAASEWQFAAFAEQDVLGQLRRTLERCAELLPPPAPLTRVTAVLFPGDPAHFRFMLGNHGLSGFGGVPGAILVRVWPSAGNLARLGPCLTRLFAHTVRNATFVPQTLGDFIALEGVAAACVAQLFPAEREAWSIPFRAPTGWAAALAHVATLSGTAQYTDIASNAYGAPEAPAAAAAPLALPLDAEELAYARAIITNACDETDPRRIAAYLYGDEIAGRQGHAVMGLPPYAGFAVAAAWVADAITARDLTLPAALALPPSSLLR